MCKISPHFEPESVLLHRDDRFIFSLQLSLLWSWMGKQGSSAQHLGQGRGTAKLQEQGGTLCSGGIAPGSGANGRATMALGKAEVGFLKPAPLPVCEEH